MAEDTSYSYIGIAACGCIRMAVVENLTTQRGAAETAHDVAGALRSGLRIERLPSSAVRTRAWTCEQHQRATAKQPSLEV